MKQEHVLGSVGHLYMVRSEGQRSESLLRAVHDTVIFQEYRIMLQSSVVL